MKEEIQRNLVDLLDKIDFEIKYCESNTLESVIKHLKKFTKYLKEILNNGLDGYIDTQVRLDISYEIDIYSSVFCSDLESIWWEEKKEYAEETLADLICELEKFSIDISAKYHKALANDNRDEELRRIKENEPN